MGSNCSCLSSQPMEDPIQEMPFEPPDFSRSLQFQENDFVPPTASFNIPDLIAFQSILRGYMVRRLRQGVSSLITSPSSNNRPVVEVSRVSVKEISPSEVPDYSTVQCRNSEKHLGKFEYPATTSVGLISKGYVEMDAGVIYLGEWNQKLLVREGKGIQMWPDGSKYEGLWAFDRANGKGRLIHSDGDVYEGTWKDDKAEGNGVYSHANGAKYVGEWKNDRQHGVGTETWPDGAIYQGNYRNGTKEGHGKFVWSDNSRFEGEFLMNNIHGFGVYEWSDGRKYVGDWKANKMDGKGTFIWNDQRKYTGEYSNDTKHGYGIFDWPDGRKYEGQWSCGKQHGKGSYFAPSTGTVEGEWREGKRIKAPHKNGNNVDIIE